MGKTTVARFLLENHFPNGRYFNWDYDEDRQDIVNKRWSQRQSLLVFDEIHKFPRWKNWIKGIEVKYADEAISRSLLYYAKRLRPQKVTQIVAQLKRPYDKQGVNIIDPISYFQGFLET